MPSQSWMPRSEYRLKRGLRQSQSVHRAGVGVWHGPKPDLPLFTRNCMEWLEEAPLPQKTMALSVSDNRALLPPSTIKAHAPGWDLMSPIPLLRLTPQPVSTCSLWPF